MIRLVITAVHPFAQAHKTAAFAHKKLAGLFLDKALKLIALIAELGLRNHVSAELRAEDIVVIQICSQYAYNLLYVRGVFKPAVTDILRVPKIFTGIAVPLGFGLSTIYSIYFFLTDRLHIIKKKENDAPDEYQVEGGNF